MNYPPPKDIRNLNSTFLLGGHDLGMLEIKKILNELNNRYFDKRLEWCTRLSAYISYFKKINHFIGIKDLHKVIKVLTREYYYLDRKIRVLRV